MCDASGKVREIVNLNQKWAFSKDAGNIPEKMPERWYLVNLPHTWNAIDGQDGGNDYYRGIGCYAKVLKKSELPEGERYYLEINGANSSADVYLNGRRLAHHDGGYSTWRIDLTEELAEDNLLVITVDNRPNEAVYPQTADFTFYGGLYRDVNLIVVNASHFDLEYFGGPGISVTPEMEGTDAKVEAKAFPVNVKDGQRLIWEILDRDGLCVAKTEQNALETETILRIPSVHLWNGRKDPYLYTMRALLCEEQEVKDEVRLRFGVRSFFIDAEKGFFLNGESYPLRGVSRHQDRWGIGNALLPEHHREDMEMICEMGANTIRLAHYQHDQFFYDLCDEKGMVVWAEIPYISHHIPEGRENTISQMKELVIQNYHHPSVVVWGLSNEITMKTGSGEDLLENHRLLKELVYSMDRTRLTTVAAVSMCDIRDPYLSIPDVIAYNHYFGWYGGDTSMNGPWLDDFHARRPEIPIGVSEYGCEGLNWHTSDPVQGDYTEEYQAFYHEELIRQLFTRPYLWATYVWNMFDFGADARNEGGENGQNHKGLVTFDRKYRKDAFYAYKAWLSPDPFVHICGKRYVDRVEVETKVTVYSNLPEVELFVNGRSLGRQRREDHFFYFLVPNEGESVLTAKAGDCMDESHIRKVETFNEKYRLREKGAVLNWFDITEKEGFYSLNDKVSEIMESEEGKKLIESLAGRLMESEGIDSGMWRMLGGFTVLRMLNTMGAVGVKMTKEELLELNGALNGIERTQRR